MLSIPIKVKLANRANYGGTRDKKDIKYIVIHYTANDGDTDENNGIYFAREVTKTSAHYFVDDDSITQTVPDDTIAYSVGGTRYANYQETGGAKFYQLCRNANSISIELCDDVKDGVVYPSQKTIENAIELTKHLMEKFNIPISQVIRHFDVTGKICPRYWAGSEANEARWKSEFLDKLIAKLPEEPKPERPTQKLKVEPAMSYSKKYAKAYKTKTDLNMRRGAGTSKAIIRVLKKGEGFRCYGYYTQNGSTIWLLGVDSKGGTGFCSLGYLKY